MCGRAHEVLTMRTLPLLLVGGLAASCTMGPPPPPQPMHAAQSDKAMRLLAGKVAGPPQDCISKQPLSANSKAAKDTLKARGSD